MKISIKYKKKDYEIEIESPKITIKEFKTLFENKFQEKCDSVKIIYGGQYLTEEETLESYNIKEENKEYNLIFVGTIKPNNIPNQPENPLSPPKSQIHLAGPEDNIIIQKEKVNNEEKGEKEDISLSEELKKYGVFMKIASLNDASKMELILENIKKRNPALLNKIINNEDKLIKFVESPITQEDIDIYIHEYPEVLEILDPENSTKNNGKVKILLTLEETEMVERIKNLGNFTEEEIIEALIIKDNNEKEAGEYLIIEKKTNEI